MSAKHVRPISAFITGLFLLSLLGSSTLPTVALSLDRVSATCTVTSSADSGPGTLRSCIAAVSAHGNIVFDPVVFPPGSPAVVALASQLPRLDKDNVTIDASDAGVILDGSGIAAEGADGILIRSNSNVIRGLRLRNFDGDGFDIDGNENIIGGDRAFGSAQFGQANIVTQSGDAGIQLAGTNNIVRGNYIGTADGQTAAGNGQGIAVINAAKSNIIGGTRTAEGNLVSGNRGPGISIIDGSSDNKIIGNYIGTNAVGSDRLANGGNGIDIRGGANYNRIGGSASGESNVVSGNDANGLFIFGTGTTSNTVSGNYVGTDLSATKAISNTFDGVGIFGGAQYNVIGGTTTGAGNVIMAVGGGVSISDSGSQYNLVVGNFIGINPAGTTVFGCEFNGVQIREGASHNRIGGFAPGERNIISGNQNGVQIGGGPGTDYNEVLGNYIGINPTGTAVIGTGDNGVYIWEQARNNRIEGNTIGGAGNSVWISMSGTEGNKVARNYIGTNPGQTLNWANNNGIGIQDGAQRNTIGPGNVVAFNRRGIFVWQPGTIENTITQNSVYSNTDFAIGDFEGGNTELAAPLIMQVDGGRVVTGSACAGCNIEFFSDSGSQARIYEGAVTADSRGNFTFTAACQLNGPNLAATATDGSGNTSSLSLPAARGMVKVDCLFLPLCRRQ